MRVLVRHVVRRGRQGSSFQDHECASARITLGRGTDQDVHLPNLRVTLAHAELIEGGEGQVRLQSPVTAGFRHNGLAAQSATVVVGDVIEIGPYRIAVVALDGYDFALEVSDTSAGRGQEFEEALYARGRLDLEAAGLRRRPWALGLAAVVLLVGLVAPLVSALLPPAGEVLRNLPVVPSDHAWLSGTVSQAHAHFADQCERCHVTPFEPTTNRACVACHENTEHHVGQDLLARGLFEGAECSDCHHEHNGRLTIVREDEGLCVNCHGGLKAVVTDTLLADATHFGSDHPAFQPLRAGPGDTPGSDRAAPGLVFPHQLHLDPDGLRDDAGDTRVLACADCHQPEPGGGLMAPNRFEEHCQACHGLRVPGDTRRELPHGDVAGTLAAVDDYFAAKALAGGYPDDFAPDVVRLRRRPGVALTGEEQREALAWARERAAMATRELFHYTGCAQCHATEEVDGAWTVKPVGIPQAWFSKARFSHGQHDAMACADCHEGVEKSEQASDLLLPDIETCRTCHGGADARAGRLASTCITCHDFHRAEGTRLDH